MTFGILDMIGLSQNPEKGGRKNADCLVGKVGKNGELIGAPAKKSIGAYTEQTALNTQLDDVALREELWNILGEVVVE
ncbi:MAG: hypothetical protein RJQ09_00600 [Cyclobacteriaceae bacterium]